MKKKHLLLIVVAAMVLFLLFGLIFFIFGRNRQVPEPGEKQPEGTEQSLIETLRNSAVKINVGDCYGSGFILSIDEETLEIATAAHLMTGYEQGIVSFANGMVGFGNVTLCDSDLDLCILSLNRSDMAEGFLNGLNAVMLEADRLSTIVSREQVYIVDSSINSGVNIIVATAVDTDYYVPDFENRMLYLYADATPGMSGSGVFDSEGYLLGLLVGGSDAGEAVCIKVSDILNTERRINK